MYPFASLPENLTAFCDLLRREHGFRIGPRELHDAARALQVTPIATERAVRDALRPVLSSTFEHVIVFDEAFRAFFHPALRPPRARALPEPEFRDGGTTTRATRADAHALDCAPPEQGARDLGAADGAITEVGEDARDEARDRLRSSYSHLEGEGAPPQLVPPDRSWRDAAQAFVKRLETGLSRRWKPAVRGPRFDLRRTLRSSLHTGGDPVQPRWSARPLSRPRFVMIIDGSRSMAAYTPPALRTAVAIASVTARVEVFVVSTALERITRDVRRAAAGEHRRLRNLHHAWGGGTGLGTCFRELLHRYGERVLGPEAVVIIMSDGLDAGGREVLRQSMADLYRRSASIIWLNPLLETPGYEPTAAGMRAARPFVTTFAWAGGAAGLRRLARAARVR